jgi:tellurite resistance-related uncharacterized protein
VERAIVGFHIDDEGDWVAHLDCGHRQHVRHKPPFQERPWVLESAGRRGRLGTPLDCPLCDRNELPDNLDWLRHTPVWDRGSMPAGFRSEHRLANGIWAVVTVDRGRATLHWQGEVACLETGATQPIPPAVPHLLEVPDGTRFHLTMYRVLPFDTEGGEAACYADRTCPECGAMLGPGATHRPDCGLR